MVRGKCVLSSRKFNAQQEMYEVIIFVFMWTADVALILFSFRCLISWSISTVRYKSNCCMNIKLNPLTVIEIVMIAIMKKYANDAITKGTQVLSGKANTK